MTKSAYEDEQQAGAGEHDHGDAQVGEQVPDDKREQGGEGEDDVGRLFHLLLRDEVL
jgi:hypothetical protein